MRSTVRETRLRRSSRSCLGHELNHKAAPKDYAPRVSLRQKRAVYASNGSTGDGALPVCPTAQKIAIRHVNHVHHFEQLAAQMDHRSVAGRRKLILPGLSLA